MSKHNPKFDHERLEVYQLALRFLAVANLIASRLPRGRSYLADQLRRAATSIVLNIAEGAEEFKRNASIVSRSDPEPNVLPSSMSLA